MCCSRIPPTEPLGIAAPALASSPPPSCTCLSEVRCLAAETRPGTEPGSGFSASAQALVRRHVGHCVERLTELHRFRPGRLDIGFNLGGRSAGVFEFRGGICAIRLHPQILARDFYSGLKETVPHEVAHFAAYRMYGRSIKPHGPEWRSLMADLGAEPKVKHFFDLDGISVRQQRRFEYRCDCSSHYLSTTRHNRVRSKHAIYTCRSCGAPLHPAPDS